MYTAPDLKGRKDVGDLNINTIPPPNSGNPSLYQNRYCSFMGESTSILTHNPNRDLYGTSHPDGIRIDHERRELEPVISLARYRQADTFKHQKVSSINGVIYQKRWSGGCTCALVVDRTSRSKHVRPRERAPARQVSPCTTAPVDSFLLRVTTIPKPRRWVQDEESLRELARMGQEIELGSRSRQIPPEPIPDPTDLNPSQMPKKPWTAQGGYRGMRSGLSGDEYPDNLSAHATSAASDSIPEWMAPGPGVNGAVYPRY
ncbi:hypothetical protein K440DRAFT_637315 [Wilcoxina mikolae CBS 423.85]|nr:hypothetical protein K440DRAFT_637315 [Wilcoxina mikolae CBS 423.85]